MIGTNLRDYIKIYKLEQLERLESSFKVERLPAGFESGFNALNLNQLKPTKPCQSDPRAFG